MGIEEKSNYVYKLGSLFTYKSNCLQRSNKYANPYLKCMSFIIWTLGIKQKCLFPVTLP